MDLRLCLGTWEEVRVNDSSTTSDAMLVSHCFVGCMVLGPGDTWSDVVTAMGLGEPVTSFQKAIVSHTGQAPSELLLWSWDVGGLADTAFLPLLAASASANFVRVGRHRRP